MPHYSYQIRKADHIAPNGRADLHVHVYFEQGAKPKPLGRYRIPTLEPVFPGEQELNEAELRALKEWLAKPQQRKKLNDALGATLFDMNKVARMAVPFSEVTEEDDGETYLTIRIPVSRRLR